MTTNSEIRPEYKGYDAALRDLIANFTTSGEDFFRGDRNVIKTFRLNGKVVNIKSFRRPNIINRIVYKYFRKPKASRSFHHSHQLLERGIKVPEPIAFYEKFNAYSITESYFISEQIYPDIHFIKLVVNPEDPRYDDVVRHFAAFAYHMHERGIEFKDFSPGNVLIMIREEGYDFYIVDLNRMSFHKEMSLEKRLKNFERLPPEDRLARIISEEYARLSGEPFEKIYAGIRGSTHAFRRKFVLRRKLKFWKGLKKMNLKKRINNVRRRVMEWITGGIGSNNTAQPANLNGILIRRILICRPNHRLGNMLMITPLMQDLAHYFPEASVDLFVQGGAAVPIFKNYPQVSRIIKLPGRPFSHLFRYIGGWISIIFGRKYDLVINAYGGSSSGRLSTRFARARRRVFIEDRKTAGIPPEEDDRHMAKYPAEQFRLQMDKSGLLPPDGPVPFMDLILDEQEIAAGSAALRAIAGNEQPTICLFTNATGDKLYPASWWKEVYHKLRAAHRDWNIVEVLPVGAESQLTEELPRYFNPDIRKVAAFFRNCALVVAGDSGVMHLASAARAPLLALFKVTNMRVYAPYNPESRSIDTRSLSLDEVVSITGGMVRTKNTART
jgi:heptosyltransferase III